MEFQLPQALLQLRFSTVIAPPCAVTTHGRAHAATDDSLLIEYVVEAAWARPGVHGAIRGIESVIYNITGDTP